MSSLSLILRSLGHYWRTNIAVVSGVGVAVTVLAGALLVGDSVRGSLRELVLQRIGATDLAVLSDEFFREALAAEIAGSTEFDDHFAAVAPLAMLQGIATDQASGRAATRVLVYGVDERFWAFHGATGEVLQEFGRGPERSRDLLISPALARELGAEGNATVLLRVQRPTDVPLESLHGRKDDTGRTIRLNVRGVLEPQELGEFSLQPQQGDVRAAFVPLQRLQQELELEGRVNALLLTKRTAHDDAGSGRAAAEALVRTHATLDDLGMRMRVIEPAPDEDANPIHSIESPGALIDERRADAATRTAAETGYETWPVFTYLINTIRSGDREIPYSLVTALDLETVAGTPIEGEGPVPPIVLNEWAARELGVKPGARVRLEYYVWEDPGRLVTRTADFVVAAIRPLRRSPLEREFAPEYPGISGTESLRDWDPPFPMDLGRIREVDEEYWRDYRTTPKAFVPLPAGQALWGSRYGSLTSIRLRWRTGAPPPEQFAERLRANLDPFELSMAVRDIRAESLEASQGATDFGEYFTYFSFFLVVSAIVLAALFFKLSVEGRVREVGLLRAVGFSTNAVRTLFGLEALVLALIGSAIGVAGALGYGTLLMVGLRTWWVEAVGTTALTLHVSPWSLAGGAAGGVLAAVVCIWWTLGTLAKVSERSLLAGQVNEGRSFDSTDATSLGIAAGLGVVGVLLALLGYVEWIPAFGAFFGAGGALLVACLFAFAWILRRPASSSITRPGRAAIIRLGVRNAAHRPARSVLSAAVVAAATFILISVDAFRRDTAHAPTDRDSGTGGYALFVETLLPIAHDPNSDDGRVLLGLAGEGPASIAALRVRPGDDASCLNLYAPQQPKLAAVGRQFVREGRFAFRSTLEGAERDNPWVLLERELPDGAIPVIADANSMQYVLHRGVGDDMEIPYGAGTLRLRFVASLADSILQSEILMSEGNFQRLFPEEQGYRMLLVEPQAVSAGLDARAIEERLADFGADAVPTAERLAEFHRVENTYLSTFQTLGGLGLLVGTLGLAAVLLRNILERRREIALLGAVGYGRPRLLAMIVSESAFLLISGLTIGVGCALIAILPAVMDRGGRLPTGAGSWLLLFAVFATGVISSILATRAAVQSRMLDALKTE